MNNPNNPNTTSALTNPQPNQVNEAPNRKFYIQTLEKHLSPDKVKQILGDLNKDWKDDRVEPVLTAESKDKTEAYDKLKVAKLPLNWEDQLERLKVLEKKQVSFNEIKKELVGWTDIFGDKKPQQAQEEIKQLEAEKNRLESELNAKISDLEAKLATSQKEKQAIEQSLGEKIEEAEKALSEWTQAFDHRQLEEVQKEWTDLKNRPDVPITEQEWLDDYARRPSNAKSEEIAQELSKKEEELAKAKAENQKIFQNIRTFLKQCRVHRYAWVDEWPTTIKQAQAKIAELLKEVQEQWTNYLDKNNLTQENIPLTLGSNGGDKDTIARIYQVLAWIKEADTTLDYEELYKRWNNGQEFNEKYDYDGGSLYLLGEYLKVKDFQPAPTTTNP